MIVRIRLSSRNKPKQKSRRGRDSALAIASLITPASVSAFVLACWKLTADFKVTGEFPIADGLFSHWQIWLVSAIILQFIASALNRYGKPESALQKTVEEPEAKLAGSRF